ncbi:hypothetical protein IFM89_035321, partial [Coptis chinensis]
NFVFSQVIFPVSRKYSPAPSAPRLKLVCSSELKALFSIDDIKLPAWLDGMCMAEYLPIIEDKLKSQLVEAGASIGARKCFIEALTPLFGRPLEADSMFCWKATFFASFGSLRFWCTLLYQPSFLSNNQLWCFKVLSHCGPLVPILLPDQVTVVILQHFNSQGTPVMSPPLIDYPWSPRWDVSKMAERIFDFLVEECMEFKKYCNDARVLKPPTLQQPVIQCQRRRVYQIQFDLLYLERKFAPGNLGAEHFPKHFFRHGGYL